MSTTSSDISCYLSKLQHLSIRTQTHAVLFPHTVAKPRSTLLETRPGQGSNPHPAAMLSKICWLEIKSFESIFVQHQRPNRNSKGIEYPSRALGPWLKLQGHIINSVQCSCVQTAVWPSQRKHRWNLKNIYIYKIFISLQLDIPLLIRSLLNYNIAIPLQTQLLC